MTRKLAGFIAVLTLITGSLNAATLTEVHEYLGQASYEMARKTLLSVDQPGIPGEDALWQSKLAGTPARALEVLSDTYDDQNLPANSRVAIGLEMARIESASRNPAAVISILRPLMDQPETELPGEVYYLLGHSFRALGQLQKAREMLASVKPSDQIFASSRFLLGDIGLQQNDATLALHYFDAALTAEANPDQSLSQVGRWKAYRLLGENEKADKLFAGLQKAFPGSLAFLEIQGHVRGEQEELAARMAIEPAPEDLVSDAETSGRYSLQMGAFSDRSLALEFQRKFQDQIPDLRIDEVRNSRGQFMYKLRLGYYANPVQARTEAKRWSDQLDTEVIVSDLGQ